MKHSDKLALVALGLGIIAGFGAIYFGANLWISLIIGAVVAGGAYHEMLKQVALENVVNSKSLNNR
jgi:hypothetical protein